jgi:nucleotide-binding universal stress UspA family protein
MSRHEPVIVVGVDRARHSRAALRWAAEEAVRRQAGLRIVHVWQSGRAEGRPRLPESSSSRRLQAARLQAARLQAAQHQATVDWVSEQLEGRTVRYTVEAVDGAPGPVLVEVSAKADLLVVGTGEHVGLDRLLHGSVSHFCVSNAICPVVAVPSQMVERVKTAVPIPGPAAQW